MTALDWADLRFGGPDECSASQDSADMHAKERELEHDFAHLAIDQFIVHLAEKELYHLHQAESERQSPELPPLPQLSLLRPQARVSHHRFFLSQHAFHRERKWTMELTLQKSQRIISKWPHDSFSMCKWSVLVRAHVLTSKSSTVLLWCLLLFVKHWFCEPTNIYFTLCLIQLLKWNCSSCFFPTPQEFQHLSTSSWKALLRHTKISRISPEPFGIHFGRWWSDWLPVRSIYQGNSGKYTLILHFAGGFFLRRAYVNVVCLQV